MSNEEDLDLFEGVIQEKKEITTDEVPLGKIEYFSDVPLDIRVEIGSSEMTIKEILALKKGVICEFPKVVGEPMDVKIGSRFMARGEIVVVNEKYGIRISEVNRVEED